MSVGGHAYRHALQRAPSRLDYVWISDELLSLTFQRFVNGQRRYGSRVPGPLEASRRLAKRRNTDLAVAGSSFDPAANVAYLFGANGKGHVRQWDDSPWSSRWPEPLELFSYSDQPPAPFGPAFLSQSAKAESWGLSTSELTGNAFDSLNTSTPKFEVSLARCDNTQDVKEALEWYQIDLRKEPEYSRMIFNHFYRSIFKENQASAIHNLIQFLNDVSVNIHGVGNYGELFKLLSTSKLDAVNKNRFIDVVTKAIGLGVVPIVEINQILRLLPVTICGRGRSLRQPQTESLFQSFHSIWHALQSCSVFKLHEMYHGILEPWIDQLMSFRDVRYLRLAREILIAYHGSMTELSHSISLRALHFLSSRKALISQGFLESYLDRALMLGNEASLRFAKNIIFTYHRYEPMPSDTIINVLLQHLVSRKDSIECDGNTARILPDVLKNLNIDLAARYVILITERLAFTEHKDSLRGQAIKVLRNCLLQIDRPTILSSQAWLGLEESSSLKAPNGLRVALRTWIWSALSTTPHRRATGFRSSHPHSKQADSAGIALLKLFDDVTTSIMWRFHGNRIELLPKLIAGLQELDIPSNQVLKKVYTLLSNRHIRNASTLQSFRKLEEGQITLKQAALERSVFNSTKHHLLSSHLSVIGDVDVTSSDFIKNMVEMVEQDNRKIRDIIFLISFHTPLKIALAMASTRNAGFVPNTKRVKAILKLESKGKQLYLEPHACVAFIHLLAASIAVSDKVSPRAALNLVSYLYRYLTIHNAPVKPNFARAMYHCGITRFSRNGLRVSRTQEDYIMHVVERYEEPETVRKLFDGSFESV